MTDYLPIPAKWFDAPSGRLDSILRSWAGTPYNMKFVRKGTGVYCSAFVCRVLEELCGYEQIPLQRIPHDAGFHSRDTAMAGLRWFLRRFEHFEKLAVEPDTLIWHINPGDVLITAPRGGGPGHAAIVGPQRNTYWQATASGVHFTGMSLPREFRLWGVYRSDRRDLWI